MATCEIAQFQDAQNDNQIQVAGAYNGIEKVTYTTATSSAAMNADTRLVRIIADATVYLNFTGAAATVANGIRLPANTVEYFGVMPGQTISCYDGSS
jgi:hypothetical protein